MREGCTRLFQETVSIFHDRGVCAAVSPWGVGSGSRRIAHLRYYFYYFAEYAPRQADIAGEWTPG